MFDLKINKEILFLLKKSGFYPDTLLTQYFILMSLKNKRELFLNILDDEKTSKRFIIQYFELVRLGLIDELLVGNQTSFVLTDKGESLVDLLEKLSTPKVLQKENVEDWFSEWFDLFPKGIKTGGKLVRSDEKGCLKKMQKFIKDYPFDKNTILKATKEYLNEFEIKNWEFVKSATYFIHKMGEGSELAGRCELILDEPTYKEIFESNVNTSGLI